VQVHRDPVALAFGLKFRGQALAFILQALALTDVTNNRRKQPSRPIGRTLGSRT
jgi:hypothetical protein